MDRVVLRAPSTSIDSGARRKTISWAVAALFIIVLTSTIDAKSRWASLPWPSSDLHRPWTKMHFLIIDFTIATILLGAICVLWNALYRLYQTLLGPRRFVEAAIEITPFGVQLVSVYGLVAPLPSKPSSDALSIQSTKPDDNEKNRKDFQYKVREFLPRSQILDVIVMEVVWPHCVWSQVVFRVVKGDIKDLSKNLCSKMQGESESSVEWIGPGCKDNQNNGHNDTNALNIQQQSRQSQSTSLIQALLQQNQVSIIPAFPEECQGMLTYEQCLKIQAEIEGLLG